jgi:hypothetical protein
MDTVSLTQTSMFVPPSSQKEMVIRDPASLSNSLECKKAIEAIQKEYGLHKCHIHRYYKTLHKHGWDLHEPLEELHKFSEKWKKKDGFSSGRIKEIRECSIPLTTLCLSVSFFLSVFLLIVVLMIKYIWYKMYISAFN